MIEPRGGSSSSRRVGGLLAQVRDVDGAQDVALGRQEAQDGDVGRPAGLHPGSVFFWARKSFLRRKSLVVHAKMPAVTAIVAMIARIASSVFLFPEPATAARAARGGHRLARQLRGQLRRQRFATARANDALAGCGPDDARSMPQLQNGQVNAAPTIAFALCHEDSLIYSFYIVHSSFFTLHGNACVERGKD